MRGTPPDALGAEVVARLRGELRAARFEVEPAAQPDEGSAREVVERAARAPGVLAAMGVFFDAGEPEVWVADARSGRTTVEPLIDPAGGERRANALAAKAVDLLRAVLAEIPMEQRHEPPAVVVAAVAAGAIGPSCCPAAPPAESMLLAGVGWLRAGSAGTLAPALSLAVVRDHLGARLAAGGLGSSDQSAGRAGGQRARGARGGAVRAAWPAGGSRRAMRACGTAGGGVELLRVTGAARAQRLLRYAQHAVGRRRGRRAPAWPGRPAAGWWWPSTLARSAPGRRRRCASTA